MLVFLHVRSVHTTLTVFVSLAMPLAHSVLMAQQHLAQHALLASRCSNRVVSLVANQVISAWTRSVCLVRLHVLSVPTHKHAQLVYLELSCKVTLAKSLATLASTITTEFALNALKDAVNAHNRPLVCPVLHAAVDTYLIRIQIPVFRDALKGYISATVNVSPVLQDVQLVVMAMLA